MSDQSTLNHIRPDGAYVIAEFEIVMPRGTVHDAWRLARTIAGRFAQIGLDGGEPTVEVSDWDSSLGRVMAWKAAGMVDAEGLEALAEILDRPIGEGEPTMGSLCELGHIPAEGHTFGDGWGAGYYYPDIISSAYVSPFVTP